MKAGQSAGRAPGSWYAPDLGNGWGGDPERASRACGPSVDALLPAAPAPRVPGHRVPGGPRLGPRRQLRPEATRAPAGASGQGAAASAAPTLAAARRSAGPRAASGRPTSPPRDAASLRRASFDGAAHALDAARHRSPTRADHPGRRATRRDTAPADG